MALERRSRLTGLERARERGALAAVVAMRRQELSLTQAELAELAGTAKGPVVALEAGRSVSLEVLLSVLDVLGLHLELQRGAAANVQVGPGLLSLYGLEPDPDSDHD